MTNRKILAPPRHKTKTKAEPQRSDGSALRDWRTKNGLTLEAMQGLISRHGSNAGFSILSRVERGKHVPPFDLLTAIYRMTAGSVTPTHFLPPAVIKLVETNRARREARAKT